MGIDFQTKLFITHRFIVLIKASEVLKYHANCQYPGQFATHSDNKIAYLLYQECAAPLTARAI